MTRKFSFRTILSLLTTALVIYVIYANRTDIVEATKHLADTNIFVLLLLIPEQLFMYFACVNMKNMLKCKQVFVFLRILVVSCFLIT